MLMWHDIARRDTPLIGQHRGKTRASVDGCGLPGAAPEFADFDSNALSVAHATVVCVITLFCREQVRYGFSIIDAKMPHNPARPTKPGVVFAALALHQKILSVISGG
jgi:hypothetical protein